MKEKTLFGFYKIPNEQSFLYLQDINYPRLVAHETESQIKKALRDRKASKKDEIAFYTTSIIESALNAPLLSIYCVLFTSW